jgi:hypothetical protein
MMDDGCRRKAAGERGTGNGFLLRKPANLAGEIIGNDEWKILLRGF